MFCICKTICFAQVYVFAYAKVYTLYKTYSFAYAKYIVLRMYMALHAATMPLRLSISPKDKNSMVTKGTNHFFLVSNNLSNLVLCILW